MTTSIATREVLTRPSLGRPADDPNIPKKRMLIQHCRQGTVLKTKVTETLTRSLEAAKRQLEEASGTDFSYTFLVRRALDLYMKQFARLNAEQITNEAATLKRLYR
jgi:hypothetical protein